MSGVLKFDDFIKKHKDDSSDDKMKKLNIDKIDKPNKIEEEEKKDKKLPPLEEGDYVKDRYDNTYEVIKTTKSFKEADEIDDWDQISKFKDNPDVTFVIVWAKSTHQKKLVFVYGVDDDMYSVKKTDNKNKEDFFTQTFRKACAEVDEDKLEKFKKRWRKFIDMVRDGDINSKQDEKLILNQILSDFDVLSVIKKAEKKKDKTLDKDETVTKSAVKESRIWEDEDEKGAGKKVVDSPVETPGPEPKSVEKAEKKAETDSFDDAAIDTDAAKEPDDKEKPSEEDLEREEELNTRESDLEKREKRLEKREEYERNKRHGEEKHEETRNKEHKESKSDNNSGKERTDSQKEEHKEKSHQEHRSNSIGNPGIDRKSNPGSNNASVERKDSKGNEDKTEHDDKHSGSDKEQKGEGDNSSKDKKQDEKTVFFGKPEKIVIGPQSQYGSYEVSYGNKTYYVMPEEDQKETSAYIDEQCKMKATGKHHILKFKIKDLFGIEKYVKHPTTAAEPGMWNSEKEAKERATENIEKMKKAEKEKDKKDKKDDD